jgi:hypothetical protein
MSDKDAGRRRPRANRHPKDAAGAQAQSAKGLRWLAGVIDAVEGLDLQRTDDWWYAAGHAYMKHKDPLCGALGEAPLSFAERLEAYRRSKRREDGGTADEEAGQ